MNQQIDRKNFLSKQAEAEAKTIRQQLESMDEELKFWLNAGEAKAIGMQKVLSEKFDLKMDDVEFIKIEKDGKTAYKIQTLE